MSWRNTYAYKKWKKDVIARDGECVLTGLKTKLHAHHMNHSTYFPEQRLDVANGVTCHKYVHKLFHIMYMRGYRKKCTKADWDKFVWLFRTVMKITRLLQKN